MTEITLNSGYLSRQWEIFEWCERRFGPGIWASIDCSNRNTEGYFRWAGTTWIMDSIFGNTHVYFKNPEDATMFQLKWVS